MPDKKRLFIYPNTSETYRVGGNSYIRNLILYLGETFSIVNQKTKLGLLDMLLKIHKCDVIYFNWIEDVPERRFGFLQIPLLIIVLILTKLMRIRIVWFIHNNVSHSRKHAHLKKFIIWMMRNTADIILSHSSQLRLNVAPNKLFCFDHPVEAYQPVVSKPIFKYDLLVWGTVSPYKGIGEFVEYVSRAQNLHNFKILIAGKFQSEIYYENLKSIKSVNVEFQNKVLSEEELTDLFSECRYVLFTYNSPSVLSSAALCKTLSFGKEIIGPEIGAFKELGDKRLLHTYQSFHDLETLLYSLKNENRAPIDNTSLAQYIDSVSWKKFAEFLTTVINKSFKNNFQTPIQKSRLAQKS